MVSYGAILSDPPWRFETFSDKGRGRSPKYRVERAADLAGMSPPAADNSALFMWTIDTHMQQALSLIAAWGFEYKTVAFIWVKPQMGLGYWTRKEAEICLMGTRGKPKRIGRGVRQVIRAPRREHSRKPDEIYSRIEALVGGPYLEMFARQEWPGWASFGNETDRFVVAA
jgi:N6-adenosine-specific RNA methylase IME4